MIMMMRIILIIIILVILIIITFSMVYQFGSGRLDTVILFYFVF